MRQSQLFTKTRREAPKDEVSKNAQLLIRGGFIHKEMAGVYSFLPLGLRVFNKVVDIIRDEMNCIGGQEVHLSALQDPQVWHKSGRWDDEVIDVWFKTQLATGTEIGLGNTHEEPMTAMLREHLVSYRDLPLSVYQFQTKFRNELRAKSGLMRTREFVMKDMYSFSRSSEEHETFYEACSDAYHRVFDRAGLGAITYKTFASGGSFSKFSHEFQTVCDAGEDTIYVSAEKKIAVNEEVMQDDILADLGLSRDELVERKSIEVGNIFSLGTRFSDALDLKYVEENGERTSAIMGCYGIGPARLMATVAELHSTEKGIVWPQSVAPFTVHLVELSQGEGPVREWAKELYEEMKRRGVSVLYDDRDARAGEKFADADLIGCPYRVVVSERNLADKHIEILDRVADTTTTAATEQLWQLLQTNGVDYVRAL